MGRGLGLAVALCAAARVTAWDMDGSVIIGTEVNFDEIISASSFSLVEFCESSFTFHHVHVCA